MSHTTAVVMDGDGCNNEIPSFIAPTRFAKPVDYVQHAHIAFDLENHKPRSQSPPITPRNNSRRTWTRRRAATCMAFERISFHAPPSI